MFKEEREISRFSWDDLGDIESGRPNIGPFVPVLLYRLIQYTLRDVLITKFDTETARDIFVEAGRIAGREFYKNVLNCDLEFKEFLKELKKVIENAKIGKLTIEKADYDSMEMIMILSEDLDCSGLPVSDETVCNYDEGFIKGILEEYSAKEFTVTEIDCWSKGARSCRFKVDLVKM